MRGIGDQRTRRIKNGAREIQPFFNIDRKRGVLQRIAHLFGNRHKQIIEHFQHHWVAICANRHPRCNSHNTPNDKIANRGHFGLPTRFDHIGSSGFGDQGWPHNSLPCGDCAAGIDRCRHKLVIHIALNMIQNIQRRVRSGGNTSLNIKIPAN